MVSPSAHGAGAGTSGRPRGIRQNTAGGPPIPGKQGGCPPPKSQALDAPPNPSPQCGDIGEAIRIATMDRSLFDRTSRAKLIERLLAGPQTIRRARHAPGRKHRQRAATNLTDATTNQDPIVNAIMCLSAPPPVAHDRDLPAGRALPRKPITLRLLGVALCARTWDKDDHGREGMPRNRHPPRHMIPRPRLRS
jgi:hypothetical protein